MPPVRRPPASLSLAFFAIALAACASGAWLAGAPWLALIAGAFATLLIGAAIMRAWLHAAEASAPPRISVADAYALLARVLNQIPYPIYIKDAGGRYITANEAFAAERGMNVEDIVGRHTRDMNFPPELLAIVSEEDRKVLAGERVMTEQQAPHPVTEAIHWRVVTKGLGQDERGAPLIVACHHDITSWRIIEQELEAALREQTALRERTQRFIQRLVDAFPDPVYVKDAYSARFLLVNDAFSQERGIGKERLLELTSYDIATNDQIKATLAREDADILAGHDLRKEQHTQHPVTGLECFRIVTKRLSRDADDRPVIVGVHYDLTGWRQSQRELQSIVQRETALRQRVQTYMQRLIDVIPQPVYVKDAEGRYIMINEAFCRERAEPREQILGRSAPQMSTQPEVARSVAEEDARVLAGATVLKEEDRPHPKTGAERHRIISKGSCLDEEGRPVVVGANFDITSLRVAERQLQTTLSSQSQLREFLQSIFDVLPNPLFVENGAHRYVMANRAFAALLGTSVDALLSQDAPAGDAPLLRALESQREGMASLAEGAIRESELRVESGDEPPRHFVLRTARSHGMDGEQVWVSILSDVSSLRNAEAGWQQAKEAAEQASAAKSLFLASMSHEIRTPLSGVIGTLRIALREPAIPGTTREHILASLNNAESLLAIINDILDFSKIEAGKLSLEHIDFDLRATVRHSMQTFRDHLIAKSLQFALDIDPRLPEFLRGDPTRLRQILINLVGNAVKFTHNGTIALRAVRLRRDGDERCWIRFRVEDTGIGIAPEALPRLFEKFQQADSSTTRRYGGTGLGLAICRQLVEAMGGEISVSSQVGVGTTFEFVLPMEAGQAPRQAEAGPLLPHAHCLRVLCAEDYPTNQLVIRTLLADLGHTVQVVGNGLAAVRALAEADYDLVLMDGRMPEMDGAEATRAIRAGGLPGIPVRNPGVRVIALTANASEEDRQHYLDAGMDDFLTKPVELGALHAAIGTTISLLVEAGADLPRLVRAAAPAAAPQIATPAPSAGTDAPAGSRAGKPPLAERLRTLFAGSVPGRLAELDRALAETDMPALQRVFHGVRGSAAYAGAQDLQTLAATLEEAADAGDMPTIRAHVARFRERLAGLAGAGAAPAG